MDIPIILVFIAYLVSLTKNKKKALTLNDYYNGKRVLVTGGNSGKLNFNRILIWCLGIGEALAVQLCKLGSEVIITGRDELRLKGVLDRLQSKKT
jgi:short-subunit dehydrogenase involved in D-alanine esterification of teichoic acids